MARPAGAPTGARRNCSRQMICVSKRHKRSNQYSVKRMYEGRVAGGKGRTEGRSSGEGEGGDLGRLDDVEGVRAVRKLGECMSTSMIIIANYCQVRERVGMGGDSSEQRTMSRKELRREVKRPKDNRRRLFAWPSSRVSTRARMAVGRWTSLSITQHEMKNNGTLHSVYSNHRQEHFYIISTVSSVVTRDGRTRERTSVQKQFQRAQRFDDTQYFQDKEKDDAVRTTYPWTFNPSRGRRGSSGAYGSPISCLNKSLIQAPLGCNLAPLEQYMTARYIHAAALPTVETSSDTCDLAYSHISS